MNRSFNILQNVVLDNSWDFKGANTKYYTHGIHSYPAMMIPQVASRLIKENLKDGSVILDPFCGSGTVLVESMLVKKESFGIDINPLATLIAEAKTTAYDINELKRTASDLITSIERSDGIKISNFFNIEFWFKPKVIRDLAIIKYHIDKIKNNTKLYFLVCFSETVRKSSNVRQGGFKLHRISDEMLKLYSPDAIKIFKNLVYKNLPKIEEFLKIINNPPKPKILLEDTRKKSSIPNDYVDLIITSPPYGDSRTTVAYGQFSRLSLQWLGFDKQKVMSIDNSLLGGKRADITWKVNSVTLKDFVKKIEEKDRKRADDILSFYVDLDKSFAELNRVTRKGARICMVVGNRTVKGYQLPTHKILQEIGESNDMKHIKTIFRNIPSKRIPLMNAPSNIRGELSPTMTKEAIVMLSK